jgi:hypothetical protein
LIDPPEQEDGCQGQREVVLVEFTEDGFVARTEPALLTFTLYGAALTYEVAYGTCPFTFNGHTTH